MAAVYATIVPHEEQYLRSQFGEPYERYCAEVPQIVPQLEPAGEAKGTWKPDVIAKAETNTFVTFGAMLAVLALQSAQSLAMSARGGSSSRSSWSHALPRIEFWGGLRVAQLGAAHRCACTSAWTCSRCASRCSPLLGAQRPATVRKTFGYGRMEILGALINGSVLLAATAFIAYEAVQRFFRASHPHGALMSAVAGDRAGGKFGRRVPADGTTAKRISIFRPHCSTLLGDALGALAVIVGGAVIAGTGADLDRSGTLAVRRGNHRRRACFACCAMQPTCCSKAFPADVHVADVARCAWNRSRASPPFTICTYGRSARVRARFRRTFSTTRG